MAAKIEIRLFATLSRFLPRGADQYAIEPRQTVGTLLECLKIPREKAKLVFVNGIRAALDTPLEDGDRVGIFPPVGGG